MFVEPRVVGQPNVPDIDGVGDDIRDILISKIFTNNGPYVRRFEEEIRRKSGADHCVVTCNATAALEMTIRALGLKGEIIVPSFTFIATAHSISWLGLTPVFVDVDPVTHTIDVESVEASITPSTSAICGVHLWGNPCNTVALQAIADRHDLALIFDAAHAFAVRHDGAPIGSFGTAEVFSFHATKFVNAFEGGAVVTNDESLAETLRQMRNFGFAAQRQVAHLGTNAKMPEVSAAMGLKSLEYIDQIQEVNLLNWSRYKNQFECCPGVDVSAPLNPEDSNCQYVVCEIDERESGISRDQLLNILEAEGVLAKRYFHPGCHMESPYRESFLRRKMTLPVTEELAQSVLVMPTGMGVGIGDIDRICSLTQYIIEFAEEIQSKLEHRVNTH